MAEGDSWFDYTPGVDILDNLRLLGYPISSVAQHGDTLENMTYGTDTTRNYVPRPPQLGATLDLVRRVKPKFFLFSGGGNDVAGAELESYMNHVLSPAPGLRTAYVDYVFGTVVRDQYQYIIDKVKGVQANIHIIIHGYGNAIPDGRAVFDFPLGFHFVGPWLKPALAAKGFATLQVARPIVTDLVKRFNDVLKDIASKNTNVHYIDLRPTIQDADWVNELHLSNSAYRRVASVFDQTMRAVP